MRIHEAILTPAPLFGAHAPKRFRMSEALRVEGQNDEIRSRLGESDRLRHLKRLCRGVPEILISTSEIESPKCDNSIPLFR